MLNNVDNRHESDINQNLVRHRHALAGIPGAKHAELGDNMKAPSTNFAYPDAKYPLNPPSKGHNSTGLQIHHYNHINLRTDNTSNVGTTPEQSNTNGGQSNPQKGQTQYMNTPHIPQYRTSLSQLHSGTSDNNANVPTAPINTPTAPTKAEPQSTSTISHHHRNHHTN